MHLPSIRTLAFDLLLFLLFLIAWLYPQRAGAPEEAGYQGLEVTVTAYNSVVEQTDADPLIAAWGDRIAPGMSIVAVSRDLIPQGLTRRARVRIHGLPGEFLVLDKMNKRYARRIDIYMGEDIAAARQFGRREARIYWIAAL